MTDASWGRVDFHLHSYASNVTDYYAANTFAIPESYSDPIATYHELKRQGMTLVTLTDHNSIDGVKRLLDARLPGVFISAEMTATFPEDGCNIHVTVANVTEAQFAEANRLRGNLYEMLQFLDAEIASEGRAPAGNRIAYFMTHPLMSTQNRPYGREGSLAIGHIEKALLLFQTLEVRNGTRTRFLNDLTMQLVTSLDAATMERLANEHGILPRGKAPWLKGLVAGSDDHSGINQGRTWTEFPMPVGRQAVPNDLIDAIRARRTRIDGAHGGPVTLAHAMVKLLYDGNAGQAQSSASAGKPVSMGGPINSLLRFVFDAGSMRLHHRLAFQGRLWYQKLRDRRSGSARMRNRPFEKILGDEARYLLGDPLFRRSLAAAEKTDDRIFLVVSTLVNRIFQRYVERIRSTPTMDLMRVVKELVALVSSNVFVSLPYLLSYLHQSSDRMLVRDVRRRFDFAERQKLVLVTDTFFDINGVARTIRRMIVEAERRDIDFTVVTCLSTEELARLAADGELQDWVAKGRVKIIPSVVDFALPEYPGLQVRVPPFLELLKFLQEAGFTKMQISTPGAIGVAGLLAAKLLQIETSSTYHTSFPEYIENYTRDISLEALAWKYMILFYHSVDEVVVPSKFIARLLHQRGLRSRKLLILDRWVDTERFHPRHRRRDHWLRHGILDASVVKFLYVGRVGLEKNLDTLADAFVELHRRHAGVHLVVVGDGPYRRALEARLTGLPVTFTGFLEGVELAQTYASADVKLFPSTTDTWGNAPLEAQSSGVPVVVSDQGGPQELIVDGVTGFRVRGRDVAALVEAMERLMDPELRRRMGEAARTFCEQNRLEEPFSAVLDSEAYRQRVRARRKGLRATAGDEGDEGEQPLRAAGDPLDAILVDHRVGHLHAEGA